jgi:hypothetical protein
MHVGSGGLGLGRLERFGRRSYAKAPGRNAFHDHSINFRGQAPRARLSAEAGRSAARTKLSRSPQPVRWRRNLAWSLSTVARSRCSVRCGTSARTPTGYHRLRPA